MSTSKGWIKLYRDITEHWIYDFNNPLLLMLWIDLLFMANHKEKTISVKGQLINIQKGQFWTSIRKLSKRWEMDKNTVNAKLGLFQSDGMIFVDSRPGVGTLITITNYSVYQGFSETDSDTDSDIISDTDSDKSRTLIQTSFHHKQEYKNARMIKNGKKNNGLPPDHPDYFEEV